MIQIIKDISQRESMQEILMGAGVRTEATFIKKRWGVELQAESLKLEEKTRKAKEKVKIYE